MLIVKDLKNNKTEYYYSIKYFAREIGIPPNTLTPYIKYSRISPILNRYVVRLKNPKKQFENHNTINFGIVFYVYDYLTNKMSVYNSSNLVKFHTGIRKPLVSDTTKVMDFIGYSISSNKKLINTSIKIDKNMVKKERIEYLKKPYVARASVYFVYNYLNEVESSFGTLDEVLDFLNAQQPLSKVIEKRSLMAALYNKSTEFKTGIIKGFGIKTNQDIPWDKRSIENVWSNRYSHQPATCFDVTVDGLTTRILTRHKVLEFLGIKSDNLPKVIRDKQLLKLVGNKATVKRLNKIYI